MIASTYHPSNPHLGGIPGGFTPWKKVRVQGRIPFGCSSFKISFLMGTEPLDDIALQVDARFGENVIVRRSRISSKWGKEQRQGQFQFPFLKGQPFTILISCEPKQFVISINGKQFALFGHQIQALEAISHLAIEGDVMVALIQWSHDCNSYDNNNRINNGTNQQEAPASTFSNKPLSNVNSSEQSNGKIPPEKQREQANKNNASEATRNTEYGYKNWSSTTYDPLPDDTLTPKVEAVAQIEYGNSSVTTEVHQSSSQLLPQQLPTTTTASNNSTTVPPSGASTNNFGRPSMMPPVGNSNFPVHSQPFTNRAQFTTHPSSFAEYSHYAPMVTGTWGTTNFLGSQQQQFLQSNLTTPNYTSVPFPPQQPPYDFGLFHPAIPPPSSGPSFQSQAWSSSSYRNTSTSGYGGDSEGCDSPAPSSAPIFCPPATVAVSSAATTIQSPMGQISTLLSRVVVKPSSNIPADSGSTQCTQGCSNVIIDKPSSNIEKETPDKGSQASAFKAVNSLVIPTLGPQSLHTPPRSTELSKTQAKKLRKEKNRLEKEAAEAAAAGAKINGNPNINYSNGELAPPPAPVVVDSQIDPLQSLEGPASLEQVETPAKLTIATESKLFGPGSPSVLLDSIFFPLPKKLKQETWNNMLVVVDNKETEYEPPNNPKELPGPSNVASPPPPPEEEKSEDSSEGSSNNDSILVLSPQKSPHEDLKEATLLVAKQEELEDSTLSIEDNGKRSSCKRTRESSPPGATTTIEVIVTYDDSSLQESINQEGFNVFCSGIDILIRRSIIGPTKKAYRITGSALSDSGRIHVHCLDSPTVTWLIKACSNLSWNSSTGLKQFKGWLSHEAPAIPKITYKTFKVWVPGATANIAEFFQVLQGLNEGLSTDLWRCYDSFPNKLSQNSSSPGISYILGIDMKSVEYMENNQLRLFYGSNPLVFNEITARRARKSNNSVPDS